MKAIFALVVPLIAALALGITLILLFGLTSSFSPLDAAIPTIPEPMSLLNTSSGMVCGPRNHATPSSSGSGLVGVTPSPTAVTAEWVPGLDSRTCRARLTHGDQVIAGVLADAIDDEPKVPPGSYMCPSDSGTRALLYFSYGHSRQGEVVTVDLEGCLWIGNPARTSRWWSENPNAVKSFAPALAALAPHTWHS